ncbi:hypothetical protein M2451_003156 [Dysgonomonas sp. PFB1-18]|uniref:hypothetical protein n=1 Tax=unclassified Dysgonomonas TaxID=2630389 RepID=UPI002475B6F7|nr:MULTISPECIES: hypothetical protein [unclassified Dysgonomonas]MDL2303202.1 hypothetical protein [Dysgonomonas sp. OttesenSCG-928-D17]MDH6310254.1 hypothetical protein [Dysgonomonas sp. PF1-14]MDH6340072.1 hypothetical protein [Dysgonomonas sp. PF1-16]MDH6381821.1 hypothetical protein [Dysgonomonas sp. PFB1-18]MDH6398937.1 hypothetical protein [Dysgonomonas sp. PF1-23]
MKKLIITIFSLFLLLTSCSVYEDLYFLENGQVKYNMTIDAAELLAIAGTSSLKNSNNKYPKDSIMNFSEIIRETVDSIPSGMEQDIKNTEPLYMRVQNDDSLGIFKISIYGDFDNIDAFTNAFASMSKLEKEGKSKTNNSFSKFYVNDPFGRNSYSWDGTMFKRVVTAAPEKIEYEITDNNGINDEEENDNTGLSLKNSIDGSMDRLFSQGNMVIKYHFPKKIKKVSNENATFSMDGKTAILNYSAALFLNADERLSIEIETE